MIEFSPQRRSFLLRSVPTSIGAAAGALVATPGLSQDMGESGMALPSFFFSGLERRQREACENKLPECRPAIKAQMAFEKDISLLLPWLGLAGGVIALLMYMRKKEQAKQAQRKLAQKHHVAGSFKKMGEHVGEDRAPASQADDRF